MQILGRRRIGCGALALMLPAAALGLLGWGFTTYHALTRRQVDLERVWSQLENAYQRRLDLVPNLVETIEGFGASRNATAAAVLTARAELSRMIVTEELLDDPERFRGLDAAQARLSEALSRLLLEVERRPQLRANHVYLELRSELQSSENRIGVERSRFNASAARYNAAIRAFPARFVANVLGFGRKQLFEERRAGEPGSL